MTTKTRTAAWWLVLAALPLAGCGATDGSDSLSRPLLPEAEEAAPVVTPSDPLAALPATFTGVLPCADCPGIDYHLNLFPDRTYFLRTTHQERAMSTRDDIGRWAVGSDGTTLVLTSDHGAPLYFGLDGHGTLRKLDANAHPMVSAHPSLLVRAPSFRTIEVSATMRGAYVGMMETGMFTECSTQRRWLVASEGASAELDSVYKKRTSRSGEALIVSVRGRIANRPAKTGVGSVDVLVVDQVVSATPGGSCPPAMDTARLEGTRWQLTRVRGEDVVASPGRTAPPVLTLGSTSAEFSGSTGCNRTLGSFRLDGQNITFTPAVSTRMECPADLAADEAFVSALAMVRRWRIIGRILELTDASGTVLARFDAT